MSDNLTEPTCLLLQDKQTRSLEAESAGGNDDSQPENFDICLRSNGALETLGTGSFSRASNDSRTGRANRWKRFQTELPRLSFRKADDLKQTGEKRVKSPRSLPQVKSSNNMATYEIVTQPTFIHSLKGCKKRLQRTDNIFQSEGNSRTSKDSNSKQASLESCKSDGQATTTAAAQNTLTCEDSNPELVRNLPGGEYLPPALTITLPTEDDGEKQRECEKTCLAPCSELNAPAFDRSKLCLCYACVILHDQQQQQLFLGTNRLVDASFRRHSHYACGQQAVCKERRTVCRNCQREFIDFSMKPRPVSNSTWSHDHIYPPTRTRNASCSGIDLLAGAILRAKEESNGHMTDDERSPVATRPKTRSSSSLFAPLLQSIIRKADFNSSATGRFLPNSDSRKEPTKACKLIGCSFNLLPQQSSFPSACDSNLIECNRSSLQAESSLPSECQLQLGSRNMQLPVTTQSTPHEGRLFGKSSHGSTCDQSVESAHENCLRVPIPPSSFLPNHHCSLLTRTKPILSLGTAASASVNNEVPLNTRIRRVSMLLLSRQLPVTTQDHEPKVGHAETHDLAEQAVVPTAPRLRTTALHSTFQDTTDNWSLNSGTRRGSLTSEHIHQSQLRPKQTLVEEGPKTTFPLRAQTTAQSTFLGSMDAPTALVVTSLSPPTVCRGQIGSHAGGGPASEGFGHPHRLAGSLMRSRQGRRQTDRFSKGIGYHLGRRRRLLERRRRMADFSLAFGLFGIVATVCDSELTAQLSKSEAEPYSKALRILISVSTIILLASILAYHMYDVMIFLCEEYIKDWRISVNRRRLLQVIAEMFICSIHPVPGFDLFVSKRVYQSRIAPSTHHCGNGYLNDSINPYLLLTIPMVGRLYLAFRVLLLHSKMFNDAGSRSIGAMNKVRFDIRFALKTLMTVCPLRSLVVFMLILWSVLSWTLRTCEMSIHSAARSYDDDEVYDNRSHFLHNQDDPLGLLNSFWLISVTFLSVGYGDIVPHTSCGRTVAVVTGLLGSACTALLVAVFSRKLEMTKAEKHVLHFMDANHITKRVKHCAANVLRETWLLYKNAKLATVVNRNKVRAHQRKFLQAIYSLRKVKVEQRELQDKANSLVDLAKLQTNVFESVVDISLRQDAFQQQLDVIENTLLDIKRMMQEGVSRQVSLTTN